MVRDRERHRSHVNVGGILLEQHCSEGRATGHVIGLLTPASAQTREECLALPDGHAVTTATTPRQLDVTTATSSLGHRNVSAPLSSRGATMAYAMCCWRKRRYVTCGYTWTWRDDIWQAACDHPPWTPCCALYVNNARHSNSPLCISKVLHKSKTKQNKKTP